LTYGTENQACKAKDKSLLFEQRKDIYERNDITLEENRAFLLFFLQNKKIRKKHYIYF